ncbi:tetratricopeptide repeat protein, partial [Shewanella sp. 10N.286.51.B2]|uniref:tetratricopeptide repeat protein n=1 Tax=Shewanella sp. 10N.286.51.B2 TaxID=3229707 RepID=UPI003553FCC9
MSVLGYLSNYHNDLLCSQQTPLLIELNQDEIKRLYNDTNKIQRQSLPALVAKRVYDKNKDNKASNIIVVDGDAVTSSVSFALLESVLEQLRHELKGIKNLATLKESLKTATSIATGGLLNDFIGDHLDKGFNFIFDEVGGHFTNLFSDVAINNIDLSKTVLSSVEDLLHDYAGNSLGDVIDNINKQNLYLSASAKSEINSLSNTFSKSLKIDAFQLTFKLLLATAIDAPKLIYINNPHKLDNNSIGLLSLLLSFAKNQKDNDKYIGLSILYTYTDKHFQLYGDVDEALQNKQQLLLAQRQFAQRYAMLEKPGSDIPVVAVKSSLFIGRDEELKQLKDQFIHRKPTTLSVISGEPGIGKTALVNQHLANIQKHTENITLTLLNEVGHSSSNTGLSSIEKSILDETKRLELVAGWKDKGVNFLKNIASKDNAIKAIGTILPGVDKALSVADAGFQRVMLDNHVDRVIQSSWGDLDNKKTDEKQRQFDNLDKAIEKLKGICSEPLPMVLFIDDLQWIDDTASEYILTRLLQQPDLYIVTTLRPGDAATALKSKQASQSLHEYSIALFKACEVRGFEACREGIDSGDLKAEIVPLNGFNKLLLTELVTKVIQGEAAQHESLSNSIFSTLASSEANSVNSLFAIETINMLCDKKLYSDNEFERLIFDNPLRFNPDIKDIENALAWTFLTLQKKYQASLSHANQSSNGQSFNLMAYAVLEERLHLLKIHLGEQGNAAVNTLLFSSLLGAPFSSSLVDKVITAVASTDVLELCPLKTHLVGSESDTYLRSEHYAIIDEVYEILRRLSVNDDKYQYRHGLLHTFLDKQFDYLLDSVLIDNTVKAKDELIKLIVSAINSVIPLGDLHSKAIQALTTEQINIKLFYQSVNINVLSKGFMFNPKEWAVDYTTSLIKQALSYQQNNQVSEAIALEEKVLAICEAYYQQAPDVWARYYTISLSNLAFFYQQNNQVREAIALQEKAFAICEAYYLQAADVWAKDYTTNLNNLASFYQQNNQVREAIALQEKALAILEAYYQQAANVWAKDYTTSLNNLALSYQQNNQVREAIALQEKALAIREEYYLQAPDVWVEDYTTSLNNLASSYRKNNQVREAIALQEKGLAIREEYYLQAADVWAEVYTTSLNNLALSYQQNNQLSEAIALQEKALAICEAYYLQAPDVWAEGYTTSLNNLALSFQQNNQVREAIALQEKALAICEAYYQQAPDVWAGKYTLSLNNLASFYQQNNQVSE